MTPARSLLVVNADDFGLTPRLSHAIVRAHRDGVVTSTSTLAVALGFDEAATLARETPTLGFGAHLAMVGEDPPLLSRREVPTLVDKHGRFPLSWRTVVRRLALRQVDPDDIRREFAIQLERVVSVGVPLTHVDTHQHLHLWPTVGDVVVALAREHRIRVVRRPRSRRLGVGTAVNLLSARLGTRLTKARLTTTDDYAGLDEAGQLDRPTLARTLDRVATDGRRCVEINAHPGDPGDPDLGRFAWGYRWGDELTALTAPDTRAQIQRLGFQLVGFAELAADRRL